jgi:hypothetical protein
MPMTRACSGKCKSPCAADVLVLAACEGMVMPYRRNTTGMLTLLGSAEQGVLSSLDALRDLLVGMEKSIEQILIIGSANDMAWLRAALPEALSNRITAEIEYPLVPSWFRGNPRETGLDQTIVNLLAH